MRPIRGARVNILRSNPTKRPIRGRELIKVRDLFKEIRYVTGSGKRYTNAHTMIFLYKRCCSKTCNIFYSLKINVWGLRYLQLFAYTHAKFEELNVLLTGQARCLKTAT